MGHIDTVEEPATYKYVPLETATPVGELKVPLPSLVVHAPSVVFPGTGQIETVDVVLSDT